VLWSAQDAAISGFRVRFLWELTRPVSSANDAATRIALVEGGIEVVG
jgi:nicotinamidase/pyrazinamidase